MVRLSNQAKLDRVWRIIEANQLTTSDVLDLLDVDNEELLRLIRSKILENYDLFDALGDEDDYDE